MKGVKAMKILSISVASLALLASCTATQRASLDREAGAVPVSSGFGTAVIDNYVTHVDPASARINLQNRFAAEVTSMVTFGFDSTQLDANARAILNEQANWIRQFPELRFSVYGHTDLVGSAAYNEALGRQRAVTVVNYLVSRGVDRGRLEALVSFGETQPLIVTQGRERQNRRTVTEVAGFYAEGGHSCCLNGQYAEVIFREYVASATPGAPVEGIQGSEIATDQ